MSDNPQYYQCAERGPVTFAMCADCYKEKTAPGDALAKAWLKHHPTRLLCKVRHIEARTNPPKIVLK